LEKQTETIVSAGEDDVRLFLREIREFPRLTVEQERDLARRCADGDEDAIRHMVSSNLRLVVSIAREYAGRGVALLDLIQEGSIGLLVAAKKYDYTLEFRFSTYATKWIRQGVTRCLMNHAGLIRVPRHTLELIRKVIAARNRLLQTGGEDPTAMEIARQSGMTEEKVTQLLTLFPEVCSLDAPAGEEVEATLAVLLEDQLSPQPHEELVREELKQTLEQLLAMLTPRQQMVLRLHFGMEDGTCYSLEQISIRFGVSKERVRQIERQAMDRLQKLGAGLGLEDFLE
jgi:RNA polymerase primary sigma factor